MVFFVVCYCLLVEILRFELTESAVLHRGDISLVIDVDIKYEISPLLVLVRNQGIPVATKSHYSAIITGRHIPCIKWHTKYSLPTTNIRVAGGSNDVGHARQIEHQEGDNRQDGTIQYNSQVSSHNHCYSEYGCKVSDYAVEQQTFSVNITCTTAK